METLKKSHIRALATARDDGEKTRSDPRAKTYRSAEALPFSCQGAVSG
jgi:hypothetical protein